MIKHSPKILASEKKVTNICAHIKNPKPYYSLDTTKLQCTLDQPSKI